MSQGRYDKARASLKTIAKWNKVQIDEFKPFKEEMGQSTTSDELTDMHKSEVSQIEQNLESEALLEEPSRTGSMTKLSNELQEAKRESSDPSITFCSPRRIGINLFLYCILWSIGSFDYYLISF